MQGSPTQAVCVTTPLPIETLFNEAPSLPRKHSAPSPRKPSVQGCLVPLPIMDPDNEEEKGSEWDASLQHFSGPYMVCRPLSSALTTCQRS
eukprot:scaffold99691_cov17-Tisochrysis_lutea.AAC.3